MANLSIYFAQALTIVLVTASRIKRWERHQERLWLFGQLFGATVNFATSLWFYFVWSLVLSGISVRQLWIARDEKC